MQRTTLLAWSRAVLVLSIFCAALSAGCLSDESHDVKGTSRSSGMVGQIRLLEEFQASQARLKLELRAVPPPSRFGAASSVFVVWDRRGSHLVQLGTLEVDAAQHTARFEHVTAAGPFVLLVTAEPGASVSTPSSRTLLAQPMSGLSR